MGKVVEKWVNFGTGAGQVGDKSLPSIFSSPVNYTPTQIASEGVDKVSAHLKGIDDKFGTLGAGSTIQLRDEGVTVPGTFSILNFVGASVFASDEGSGVGRIEIGASPATFRDFKKDGDGVQNEFTIPANILVTSLIDVFYNGILQTENVDWERNTGSNQIRTLDGFSNLQALPQNTTMRVRFYEPGFSYEEETFTTDGIATEFTLSGIDIGANDLVDVIANGVLLRRDYDFEVDHTTEKITTVNGFGGPDIAYPANTKLRVRVHRSAGYVDEIFAGGVNTINPSTMFTPGDKMDVYINGVLGLEYSDWNRNGNAIDIVDGASVTTNLTRIRVRIWT